MVNNVLMRCPECGQASDFDTPVVNMFNPDLSIVRCLRCGHEDRVQVFRNCYSDPMSFGFETDMLCECGGELWLSIEQSSPPHYQCEKCDRTYPYQEGDGME